jgi:predicted nucleotidyltransferase component of viral defense system
MPDRIKDMGASVRARLLNVAKARAVSFDLILNRYAIERLLYRLSVSEHAGRFILKGATLMMTWLDEPHRGTRDLDLLGFGDSEPEVVLAMFRDVCAQPVADDRISSTRLASESSAFAMSLSTAGCACARLRHWPARRCAKNTNASQPRVTQP